MLYKLEFLRPKNLAEALKFRAEKPNYYIWAGGTDLCVLLNGGLIKPEGLISIWGCDELSGIKEVADTLEIGALSTHTDIVLSPLIKKFAPALAEACKTVGAKQIQNRGTIGGNVMNASPAGDTLPVLLAYDAKVITKSSEAEREIKFRDFFAGYKQTALTKKEIVTGFRVPKAKNGEKAAFMKVGARRAQAISKVVACFRASSKERVIESISIAYGSVAPIPHHLPKVENFLIGKELTPEVIEEAGAMVAREVTPIDDIRSTAKYRQHVSKVLVTRFLRSLT